jgi:hypothetical protein
MPSRRPIVVYLAAAFMVVSAISALMSFLFPSPWTGGLDGALEDTVRWSVTRSVTSGMSAWLASLIRLASPGLLHRSSSRQAAAWLV